MEDILAVMMGVGFGVGVAMLGLPSVERLLKQQAAYHAEACSARCTAAGAGSRHDFGKGRCLCLDGAGEVAASSLLCLEDR